MMRRFQNGKVQQIFYRYATRNGNDEREIITPYGVIECENKLDVEFFAKFAGPRGPLRELRPGESPAIPPPLEPVGKLDGMLEIKMK